MTEPAAHFDADQLALIHMVCRHERNALRGRAVNKLPGGGDRRRADRLTARLTRDRLLYIMELCEEVVPELRTLRSGDVP